MAACRGKAPPAQAELRVSSAAKASAAPAPAPAPSSSSGAVPADDAPLEELRAFVRDHPSHAAREHLGEVHDRRLLPCPGSPALATCNSPALLVAEGLAERGDAYLAHCVLCRERNAVDAWLRRLKSALLDAHTNAAWKRFDEASLVGPEQAEQVLVDTRGVYQAWAPRARARIAKQRQTLGLAAAAADETCGVPEKYAVLVSPASPIAGERVRVVVAADEPLGNPSWELVPTEKNGAIRAAMPRDAARTGGGPPYYATVELGELGAGQYRVRLLGDGAPLLCQRLRVGVTRPPRPLADGVWQSTRGWDHQAENLYSVWLSVMFMAPEPTSWQGLHAVTRDRDRNLLHGHLGLGEDGARGIADRYLEPDCADAPYYFRAYFAWKLELPFGRHDCRAREGKGPLRCDDWASNDSWDAGTPSPAAPLASAAPPREPVRELSRFLAQLKNDVHARSLRTPLGDENTDLYPVPLTRTDLRPGIVYSDPYGHTLTLVQWVKQTPSHPGQLLAVDAQPDGSMNIKRFWRGNFLFVGRGKVGGYGFKAFRPIVLEEAGPRLLSNWEIGAARGYGNYSTEQAGLTANEFYARMDRLMSPLPPNPNQVYRDLHEALHHQLEGRVRSIDLAEEAWRDTGGRKVEMPEGRAVFHATGPWEAYSTPCRDLRLLVGMDVLRAYPDEATALERDPERARRIRTELAKLHERWSRELAITYQRSDGSPQKLTLGELIARAQNLELAYNPNDCPEVRWGAPPGSPEIESCQRRAPEDQQRRMEELRHWFAQRYSCG
jgi:hypothetical protein